MKNGKMENGNMKYVQYILHFTFYHFTILHYIYFRWEMRAFLYIQKFEKIIRA